eukprot:ANDGO_06957.mRNA.1 hypothetical protein SARC_08739
MTTPMTTRIKFLKRDMYQERNDELLFDVYEQIMRVHFPVDDELDPFDVWLDVMGRGSSLDPPLMHIEVYFDAACTDTNNWKNVMGVCVWEQFPVSNCGLLDYFAVQPNARKTGLGKYMAEQAYASLQKISMTDRPSYFFAETIEFGASDGIMDTAQRQQILSRIGFSWLKCRYIQPPLSEDQGVCHDLVLLIYCPHKGDWKSGASAMSVYMWFNEFCESVLRTQSMKQKHMVSNIVRQTALSMLPPSGRIPVQTALPWVDAKL